MDIEPKGTLTKARTQVEHPDGAPQPFILAVNETLSADTLFGDHSDVA